MSHDKFILINNMLAGYDAMKKNKKFKGLNSLSKIIV